MHVLDFVVKRVFTISRNLIDINAIVMRANSQKPVIRRVFHGFNPFLRMLEFSDYFAEVFMAEDVDIALVVGDSDVAV